MENRKVIVIGAGYGGLAAAWWLRKMNYDVTLLEAANRPGGRVMTLERNGDKVDVGAQCFHSNYRHTAALISEMNLDHSIRYTNAKFRMTMTDGSHHHINPHNPYLKMLGLGGNLRMYRFLLKYLLFGRKFSTWSISKDIPEYDDVGIQELFSDPSDQKVRDYFVKLLGVGLVGGLPESISLYHFIRCLRVASSTKLYGLTQSMAALGEAIADQLPVEYEAPVKRLVFEKGRVIGVEMERDGSVERAGHVVVAVEPTSAARLMPEEMEPQRAFFDSVMFSPSPIPVFFLDRLLNKDTGVYYSDLKESQTFPVAIDETVKLPEMVPSGKSIVTAWASHPTTLKLIDEPDEVIIGIAKDDIERIIPGFEGKVEDAVVVRHPFATEQYPPGAYRRVLDFQRDAMNLRGVSFVSSLFGGNSIESAMVSAAAAVRRVNTWGGTA